MKRFLLLTCFLFYICPAYAQKPVKSGLAAVKALGAKQASVALSASHLSKSAAGVSLLKSASAPLSSAVSAKINAAALARKAADIHSFSAKPQPDGHIFAAVAERDPSVRFSGTVFEVEYNGQKEIYGAVATHIIPAAPNDLLGIPRYFVATVYLPGDPQPHHIPAEIVAVSPVNMLDIALVKFAKFGEQWLTPYKLGEITNETELHSVGFTHQGFVFIPKRKILATLPYSIRTTMPLRAGERSGLCGSPVLNAKNELVGIHTGSSMDAPFEDIPAFHSRSFVTPARYLKVLVDSYHNQGRGEMPFYIDDTHFINLNPDEYVVSYRLIGANRQTLTSEWINFRISHTRLESALQKNPQAKFLQLTTRKATWSTFGTALIENTAPDAHLPETVYLYDLQQHQLVRWMKR